MPWALFFCGVTLESYARFLWEAEIVQVRTAPPWFRWASGKESPVYVDHRRLLSYPTWRAWVVQALESRLRGAPSFRSVVGVATGGIPWAAWLSAHLGLPMGYVRPEPKGHGLGRQVEGLPAPIGPVLLIEDLLSTGGSLHKAAQALEAGGFPIAAAVVLWSYDAPGPLPFGFPLYALLTFPQAVAFWEKAGWLSSEAKTFLLNWHRAGFQLYL